MRLSTSKAASSPETGARIGVDRVDDPHRRGVVWVFQFEHRAQLVRLAGNLVLHDRAIGDPPGRRDALRQRLALALGLESGDGDGALGGRANDAVGSLQLGQEKRAAHQRGGVAERGDGDVEAGADLHAGGEVRRDDDGRDVAVAQLDAVHVHAEVLQHSLDGLLGKGRVGERVARAAQPDHEAVADELAVARVAQDGNVLDSRRRRRRGDEGEQQRDDERARHPPPTLTEPSGCTEPDTVTPLSLLRPARRRRSSHPAMPRPRS